MKILFSCFYGYFDTLCFNWNVIFRDCLWELTVLSLDEHNMSVRVLLFLRLVIIVFTIIDFVHPAWLRKCWKSYRLYCMRCLVCVGPAGTERRGGREVGASDPGARAGGGRPLPARWPRCHQQAVLWRYHHDRGPVRASPDQQGHFSPG